MLSAAALVAGTGAASAATLFENYLERGYSEVAVYALTKAQDNHAGLHFARKAADAAKGEAVMPDSPADTGRPVAQLVELYDSHNKLMEALSFGAADRNARLAAVAQVNFDCWLAELEANPSGPDSSSCRLLFYTALERISADPGLADLMTSAGSVATAAPQDDHAAGGNDNPDGILLAGATPQPADEAPAMSPDQYYPGPISALSTAAPGDYATAAWIYPPPVPAPPATPGASGAATDGTAGPGEVDPTDGAGGAVGNASGALGGAVSSTGGALGGAVGDVSGMAGGAVSAAGGALGGPIGGVADEAGQAVSGTGGALGDAVGGVTGAAGGAVSGLGGAVGGALGGLGRPRAN